MKVGDLVKKRQRGSPVGIVLKITRNCYDPSDPVKAVKVQWSRPVRTFQSSGALTYYEIVESCALDVKSSKT